MPFFAMVGNPRLKPLNETPESVSGHNDALQILLTFKRAHAAHLASALLA